MTTTLRQRRRYRIACYNLNMQSTSQCLISFSRFEWFENAFLRTTNNFGKNDDDSDNDDGDDDDDENPIYYL